MEARTDRRDPADVDVVLRRDPAGRGVPAGVEAEQQPDAEQERRAGEGDAEPWGGSLGAGAARHQCQYDAAGERAPQQQRQRDVVPAHSSTATATANATTPMNSPVA